VVAAVTVGGDGVAAVAVKVPRYLTPLLAANEFVWTLFADILPQIVAIYICVCKVLCRLVLTQFVLSVVPLRDEQICYKKNMTVKNYLKIAVHLVMNFSSLY
jgi:hypothetical protein